MRLRAAVHEDAPIHFVHHTGEFAIHWTVKEVDARAVPGSRGPRCLLFARDGAIRRVWDYPSDWRALNDVGLAKLSWRR